MLANPVGEVVAVLSARFMIYSSLLASVVFLHLVLRLFGSSSRLLLTTAYVTVGMLLLGNLGGLDGRRGARDVARRHELYWYGTAGQLAWLSPLYNVSVIGLAVVRLFLAARTSSGIRRAQANYLMVAIVPPTVIGLHDFLGLFVTRYPGTQVTFVPMIPIASVFWASLVAYTILRYRLIDLDAAIIRGMTHALLLVIMVGPLALGIVAGRAGVLPDRSHRVLDGGDRDLRDRGHGLPARAPGDRGHAPRRAAPALGGLSHLPLQVFARILANSRPVRARRPAERGLDHRRLA
jgi:hypothetical protein